MGGLGWLLMTCVYITEEQMSPLPLLFPLLLEAERMKSEGALEQVGDQFPVSVSGLCCRLAVRPVVRRRLGV